MRTVLVVLALAIAARGESAPQPTVAGLLDGLKDAAGLEEAIRALNGLPASEKEGLGSLLDIPRLREVVADVFIRTLEANGVETKAPDREARERIDGILGRFRRIPGRDEVAGISKGLSGADLGALHEARDRAVVQLAFLDKAIQRFQKGKADLPVKSGSLLVLALDGEAWRVAGQALEPGGAPPLHFNARFLVANTGDGTLELAAPSGDVIGDGRAILEGAPPSEVRAAGTADPWKVSFPLALPPGRTAVVTIGGMTGENREKPSSSVTVRLKVRHGEKSLNVDSAPMGVGYAE